MPLADHFAGLHAAGMTAPEAAAALGCDPATAYRWAKANGTPWANKKVPPPPGSSHSPEVKARRIAAMKAHTDATRAEWLRLLEAGLTAAQAARIRGVTIDAAYAAERVMGRKFARQFKISPLERYQLEMRRKMMATIPPSMRAKGASDTRRKRVDTPHAAAQRRRESLTPVVMRLRDEGVSVRDIAARLGISVGFVRRMMKEAAA